MCGGVSDRDVGLNAGPSPSDSGYTTRLVEVRLQRRAVRSGDPSQQLSHAERAASAASGAAARPR